MRAIYTKLGPKGNLAAFLLLFAIGLACYFPLLQGGLQNDDFNWFLNAATGGSLGNDHTAPQGGMFWRPVLSIVFWLLYKVFGVEPAPFRIFNVFLAALAAFALRAIWLRISPPKVDARWSGLAVGVLFVIWPTHPETTAWISGMTDGLAIALGALGLWAYLVYRQSSKSLFFVLALVLFALALLSKEAAVPFPLIAFGLLSALVPWKKAEAKAALLNGVAMLALTAAYIALRSHFVGGIIGGYGNQSGVLQTLADITGSKGAYDYSNAFIPFSSYLAYLNFGLVRPFVTLVLAGAVAWMLWSRPGQRRLSPKTAKVVIGFAALWSVAAIVAVVQFFSSTYRLFYGPLLRWGWVAGLLLIGLGYVLLIRRERARRYLIANEAFRNKALAIALCIASTAIYLAGQTWVYREFVVFPVLWWAVYALRPASSNPEKARYLTIALVSVAAAFVSLLPALVSSLPVGLDGQQSRWAYAATLFSSLGWTALLCGSTKFEYMQKRVAAWGLGAAAVLLAPYVIAWYDSGKVSGDTERLIGAALPVRRIYVLTEPGTIEGAGLFAIGLEHLPRDIYGDLKTQIIPLYRLDNALSADNIVGRRLRPGLFEIAFVEASGERLYHPSLVKIAGADTFYATQTDGRDSYVLIRDFQPSDRVMIIGPQGASFL